MQEKGNLVACRRINLHRVYHISIHFAKFSPIRPDSQFDTGKGAIYEQRAESGTTSPMLSRFLLPTCV